MTEGKSKGDAPRRSKEESDSGKRSGEMSDLEKGLIYTMNEVGRNLGQLESFITRKREEYEREGVERTVKRDSKEARIYVKQMARDLLDELDATSRKLKKILKED